MATLSYAFVRFKVATPHVNAKKTPNLQGDVNSFSQTNK